MRRRRLTGKGVPWRSGAKRRELIWVTSQVAQLPLLLGTVFTETTLVSKTDWARDATNTSNLEKGAVLLRVVGDVHFFQDAAAQSAVRGITRAFNIFGVLKRDEDDVSPLDVAVDAYAEPWMHLESRQFATYYDPTPTLATANGQTVWHVPVDIKVKRKLTSDERIQLCLQSQALNLGTDVSASWLLRMLIQLP